jgi:hypothetical protein
MSVRSGSLAERIKTLRVDFQQVASDTAAKKLAKLRKVFSSRPFIHSCIAPNPCESLDKAEGKADTSY